MRTIVNDSVEGDFAMFSTNEVDSVIMSLHGFSALGFGLQMRPNDGTYQEGIEYLNKSFSGWGSSTANPDFYGFITDGASSITDITVFTRIYNGGNYLPGGSFVFGDLHFIEQDNGSNAVPEPATMFLFGAGLVGSFIRRRRKA